jgi:hypothetical protein
MTARASLLRLAGLLFALAAGSTSPAGAASACDNEAGDLVWVAANNGVWKWTGATDATALFWSQTGFAGGCAIDYARYGILFLFSSRPTFRHRPRVPFLSPTPRSLP